MNIKNYLLSKTETIFAIKETNNPKALISNPTTSKAFNFKRTITK